MDTIAYIDGFNLYYRAVRKLKCKWLDVWDLLERSLPASHKLTRIKYFTAPIHALPGNLDSPSRQRIYLAALRSYRPNVEIISGHFTVHAKCQRMLHPTSPLAQRELTSRGMQIAPINTDHLARNADWVDDPGPRVHVINTEEKGSDVNLAVHFLNDAWANKAACFALITNDSDLAEAARIVRDQLGKHVMLLTPEGVRPSAELQQYVTSVRTMRKSTFFSSVLPSPIPNTAITKPPLW